MDINLESWLILIVTAAVAAAAITLVCKSFKYIRALCKRFALVRKIKSICKKHGYALETLASPYKSVFIKNDSPELAITKDGTRYLVRFFTCLRLRDTYTLSDIDHYMTKSNAGMYLTDMKYNAMGGLVNIDREMMMPRIAHVNDGDAVEYTVESDTSYIDDAEFSDAVRILCVNPVSVEMRRVAGNTTEPVADGDVIDGHIVYSGSALCSMLDGKKEKKRTSAKMSAFMSIFTLILCAFALCSCAETHEADDTDADVPSAPVTDGETDSAITTDTEAPATEPASPVTESGAPADTADTNEPPTLTVYYDAFNGEYLKLLVEQFMKENPDVKVISYDYTTMAADEFASLLDEKLRSGDGPDVILAENTTGTSATVPNAISLYNAGAFFDLDKLGVDLSGCNANVMAGGRYNGAQYTAPLDYSLGFVFTTKERMQRFGIPYGDGTSLSDFASAVGGYVNDGGRAFADLTIPASLAMHSGITPSSMADEKSAFTALTNAVDSIYPGIYAGKAADYIYSYETLGDEVNAFIDGKTLFYISDSETLVIIGRVYDAAIKNGETPVWFTLPTVDGGAPSPTVGHWLAVNANTKNVDAARAFVESAVGFDAQHKTAARYGIPVCESLMSYMHRIYMTAGLPEDEEVFVKWREFSPTFVNDYFDVIDSMGSAAVCDSGSLDIVNVVFSDVITGAKSVADALKDASEAIAEHIK